MTKQKQQTAAQVSETTMEDGSQKKKKKAKQSESAEPVCHICGYFINEKTGKSKRTKASGVDCSTCLCRVHDSDKCRRLVNEKPYCTDCSQKAQETLRSEERLRGLPCIVCHLRESSVENPSYICLNINRHVQHLKCLKLSELRLSLPPCQDDDSFDDYEFNCDQCVEKANRCHINICSQEHATNLSKLIECRSCHMVCHFDCIKLKKHPEEANTYQWRCKKCLSSDEFNSDEERSYVNNHIEGVASDEDEDDLDTSSLGSVDCDYDPKIVSKKSGRAKSKRKKIENRDIRKQILKKEERVNKARAWVESFKSVEKLVLHPCDLPHFFAPLSVTGVEPSWPKVGRQALEMIRGDE